LGEATAALWLLGLLVWILGMPLLSSIRFSTTAFAVITGALIARQIRKVTLR
jgi:hypothetical protein